MTDKPEFIFIDESGDPGPPVEGSNSVYILVALHLSDAALRQAQRHLTAFRYHHGVSKELKDTGALLKDRFTPVTRALLEFFAELVPTGEATATGHWLRKDTYIAAEVHTWRAPVSHPNFGTSSCACCSSVTRPRDRGDPWWIWFSIAGA